MPVGAGSIKAGEAYVLLTARNELRKGLRSAQQTMQTMANKFRMASQMMHSAGMRMVGAATAIAVPIGIAAKRFAEFSDAMAAVGAVSGASGSQLEALTQQAKELGRTTSFTATEIAMLQQELGRAGFSSSEILQATTAIQNLGRATGTDLARAAEIAAAAIRQFNLPASDSTRVADVLTATANSSAQTLGDLGEAFAYVGPVAADAGMSIEDVAKSLGVLANLGLKGSMGGTSLRRALLAFADPEIQSILAGFGVQATDARGNLRPLADIMIELGKATASMPNAQKLALFQKIFDLRGMTAGLKLSTSAAEMERLSQAIDNSGGAAEETAKKMDDTLGGTFRRIMSAAEGVYLAIGEAFDKAFQPYESMITGTLGRLTNFIEKNKQLVGILAGAAVGVAALGTAFMGIGMALGVAGIAFAGIAKLLALVAALPALIKVAAVIGTIVAAWKTLKSIGAADVILQGLRDLGNYMQSVLGPAIKNIGTIFGDTWSGIAASVRSEEWKNAGDIAMKGIEAAMLEGKAAIITIWEDIKLAIIEAISGAFIVAGRIAKGSMTGLMPWLPRFVREGIGAGVTSGLGVGAGFGDPEGELQAAYAAHATAIQAARNEADAAAESLHGLADAAEKASLQGYRKNPDFDPNNPFGTMRAVAAAVAAEQAANRNMGMQQAEAHQTAQAEMERMISGTSSGWAVARQLGSTQVREEQRHKELMSGVDRIVQNTRNGVVFGA